MPESFFVSEGDDTWRATEATRGPWSPIHQHGGPAAGLLVRAIETSIDRTAFRIARVTVQFARPLAIDVFRVTLETVRQGKKARTMRARLVDVAGKEAAVADALLLRRADVGVGATEASPAPPPDPASCAPYAFPFFTAPLGYHTAMEARLVSGRFGSGAMAVWMRMRVPLVPGEEPSPVVRMVVAADSGNGVSVALDLAAYTFLNADLTVSLCRENEGEWVLLDATSRFGADGIGLAETILGDVRGGVGRGVQTLLVERRSGP